ncbi:VWA domain-containing protein [Limnohabitans sp.]|uniref:VWA domain-containing protein n=1 Tax=Limnohabitans sp. TaxID=1907725 RepID=UPI0033428195
MADDLKGLETWNDAMTSLQLLQIDPHGFGGVWLRAPFGPVREQWLQHLSQAGLNTVKLPGNVDVERLLGGIDLSLTLQSGRLHMQSGLLQQADQGVVLISMAERLAPALIAPMTQAMDKQSLPPLNNNTQTDGSIRTQFGVVALDESMNDDAPMSPALQERLGLWFDLQELAPADITGVSLETIDPHSGQDAVSVKIESAALAHMRHAWPHIRWTDTQALAVCSTAQGLGIDSLRIPTLALRVASCHAALHLRKEVNDEDLAFAARRVLAPRATQLPAPAENAAETEPQNSSAPDSEPNSEPDQTPEENSNPNPEEPAEENSPTDESPENSDTAKEEDAPLNTPSPENLQEMMIAAALASLPSDVLASLLTKAGRNSGNTSGRSGQFRSGSQRGRPLPPRPGKPGGHARLHVLATLRAAAPKQRLRSGAQQGRVAIRAEDFHVHRYQQHSSSCLILALDASGSAALQRLAEAKGAVELLLQQSYARRDSVCIVAFKGAQAQLLLPATRSLVRAKRAMTSLPGGGGTPLALALKMACEQAIQLQRQGVTPILVVLSDGRANVNLQGLGGRAQAQADALQWAAQWRQTGHRALWIDTSLQPDAQVQNLAHIMGGSYMPMPLVQAQRMASAMDNIRRLAA